MSTRTQIINSYSCTEEAQQIQRVRNTQWFVALLLLNPWKTSQFFHHIMSLISTLTLKEQAQSHISVVINVQRIQRVDIMLNTKIRIHLMAPQSTLFLKSNWSFSACYFIKRLNISSFCWTSSFTPQRCYIRSGHGVETGPGRSSWSCSAAFWL